MKHFLIVGGEYIDPMIIESEVHFNYEIFADNINEAKDKFYIIFPSCFIVNIK